MPRLKIGDNFRLIDADLIVFTGYHLLLAVFENPEFHVTRLINDFSLFSRGSKIFDQIRMLNETGMEIIRVNLFKGKPVFVPSEQLKIFYKSDPIFLLSFAQASVT